MPAARPTAAGSKTAAQHPADGNGTIMRALRLDANRMEKERQRMPASFRKRAFRAQTKSVNPGAALINRNQRQSSLPAAICQALRDCQTRWQGDELRQAAEFRLSKHLKRAREGGSPFAFCRPRQRTRRGRGDFCVWNAHFPEQKSVPCSFRARKSAGFQRKLARVAKDAGSCGFAKGKTAASQIGNLRRGAWRGRYSPVRPLVKNTFLTSGNFAKQRSFRALTNPANAKIAQIRRKTGAIFASCDSFTCSLRSLTSV